MALRLSALRSCTCALTRQSRGTLHGVAACALIFALGISMAQTNKSDFFEKLETLDEKQVRLNIDHRTIKKD
jgi:hypothetical protein